MEDLQAIEQTLRGEIEAFEEIVRRYHPGIFRLAYRFLWSAAEADEVAQEVFMKAFKSLRSFDRTAKVAPWLNRIAVNTACSRLGQRRRRGPDVELNEGVHRSGAPSPEREAGGRMELEKARLTLASLPEEYRTVLTLRALEGRSYREIADLLECSIGTVMSRLNRARAMMRERTGRRSS